MAAHKPWKCKPGSHLLGERERPVSVFLTLVRIVLAEANPKNLKWLVLGIALATGCLS